VDTPADLSADALGQALLTTWALPFEIASVLLTAALVGAVMLARTPQEEAEDGLV
jgi:NADH-quinone oxidoreductase subunit J